MPGLKLKTKLSKGAHFAKIKWDANKHKRDKMTGRFLNKPGTDEFKAEPLGPGKTGNVKSGDVIKLHVTSNPKKAGSASAADFDQYKDDMTVGEFKTLVGPKQAQLHLSHDIKKGYITVHDPATLPAKPILDPEPPPPPKLTLAEYAITSKTTGAQPHDKIKILAGTNPKKPGSKAAEAFSKYQDEMTVGEFHAAMGGKKQGQEHILHDLKKGYISIHNPADLADMQAGTLSPGTLAAHMKDKDKLLGTVTKNPFTTGTKNYDDFEAAAKGGGLTTEAAVAAKATPAGEAKPKLADLEDDDIILSQYGTEYKVHVLKKDPDAAFQAKANEQLADGTWTVKPKVTLKDTDTLHPVVASTGQMGTHKYTLKEYKNVTGMTDAQVQAQINAGKLKLNADETTTTMTMKVGPATPPKPAATPLPKQTLEDNDLVESASGHQYTVAGYKQMWIDNGQDEAGAINKLNHFMATGSIKVVGKSKFNDDDVIETFMGNQYTMKEYKAKYNKLSDQDIVEQLQNSDIKFVAKVPPPPTTATKPLTVDDLADTDAIVNDMGVMVTTGAEAKSLNAADKANVNQALASGNWKLEPKAPVIPKLKLVDIPKADHANYDVMVVTGSNPYSPGTPQWVKFNKIEKTSSGTKSMSVQKYLASTTMVDQQEVVLQQMVDEGHVKFVTPAQKQAVADQKAKYALHQQGLANQAKVNKYKFHYEQVKPADYHGDPKWSKVPGIKDVSAPGKTEVMEKTRVAVGLKFHDRHSHEAVAYYTGSGHSPMNSALRHTGYAHITGKNKSYIKYLDSIMEPTKNDVVMWRGVGLDGDLNDIPPPSGFTDLAYSSTSHNPNQASNFAGYSKITGNKVLFRVRIPAGTNAAFISRKSSMVSAMADEAEIITARGTRYKYISTQENVVIGGHYGKIDIVEIEVVDQTGQPWQ